MQSHNVGDVFASKPVNLSYDANTSNEVPLLKANDNQTEFTMVGYYNPCTLFKNSVTNEDGTKTTTYVDLQERTIMTRTETNDGNADTYYLYNDKGLLQFVLPPMAMAEIVSGHPYTSADAMIKNYCYLYKYDGRNNVVEKQLPGADMVLMVYDKGDRVIGVQHGNSRAECKWVINQYDPHSRLVGQWYSPQAPSIDMDYNTLSSDDLMARYIYDDYPADALSFADVENSFESTADLRVKSLKTHEKVRILATSDFVERTFYYDYKSRLIQTVEKNHLGGISRYSTRYDFVGNVLATHESHEVDGQTTTLLTQNTLDHRGRVLNTTTTLNGGTPATVDYTYNELGQLTGKTYGVRAEHPKLLRRP